MNQSAIVNNFLHMTKLNELLDTKVYLTNEINETNEAIAYLEGELAEVVNNTNDKIQKINELSPEDLAKEFRGTYYGIRKCNLDPALSDDDFIMTYIPVGQQRNMLINNYERRAAGGTSIRVSNIRLLSSSTEVPKSNLITIEIRALKRLRDDLEKMLKDTLNIINNLSKN